MLLTLKPDHKKHLLFLTEQTPQVLQDFCKLAVDYLQKGPNIKLYNAAAQKLGVDADTIKTSVEAIANMLIEGCRYKLGPEDFRDSVIAVGFMDERQEILSRLYELKKNEISDALTSIGFKVPEYHDMDWRVEVQIASRALLKQVTPLITMDLSVKSADNEIEHILLQTDPVNLVYLAHELEEALQEGRSQYVRRISRAIK